MFFYDYEMIENCSKQTGCGTTGYLGLNRILV